MPVPDKAEQMTALAPQEQLHNAAARVAPLLAHFYAAHVDQVVNEMLHWEGKRWNINASGKYADRDDCPLTQCEEYEETKCNIRPDGQ